MSSSSVRLLCASSRTPWVSVRALRSVSRFSLTFSERSWCSRIFCKRRHIYECLSPENDTSQAKSIMPPFKCLVNWLFCYYTCCDQGVCYTRSFEYLKDGIDVRHLLVECTKNRDNVLERMMVFCFWLCYHHIGGHVTNKEGEWDVFLSHGL